MINCASVAHGRAVRNARFAQALAAVGVAIVTAVGAATVPSSASASTATLVTQGEVTNAAFDSHGRTYVAWERRRRANVTVRTRSGQETTTISGKDSAFAGPPRVAVIGDGVILVWLGGDRSVATYTSEGKLIQRVAIDGTVVGSGSDDPAFNGMEGRGGAVAVEKQVGEGTSLSILRFKPNGQFAGAVEPFDDGRFSNGVRFAFPGGGVTVVARLVGFASAGDYNSAVVDVRRIDSANGLGPSASLSPEGAGGSPFGDAISFTMAPTAGGSVLVSWTAAQQPGNNEFVCSQRARGVAADGSAGPLIELSPPIKTSSSHNKSMNVCPYGAAMAGDGSHASALVAIGSELRVLRVHGDEVKTAQRLSVGSWRRARILTYGVAPGRAAVAWGIYNARSKRTEFTIVETGPSGTPLIHRLSLPVDPAALIGVNVSASGRLAVLFQRKPNRSGGANFVYFSR